MSESSGQEQGPKQSPAGEVSKPKSGWIEAGAKPPKEVLPPEVEEKLRTDATRRYESLSEKDKKRLADRTPVPEGDKRHTKRSVTWHDNSPDSTEELDIDN